MSEARAQAMMRVWYIDPSPYARIVRATLLEFGLAHEAVELSGFPPQGVEDLSPAWKVPVLETPEAGRLFGSGLIREYLHGRAGATKGGLMPALTRPGALHWRDAQILTAIQELTDALVVHFHFKWAGAKLAETHILGCDIIAREMGRTLSLLDWLEAEASPLGFRGDGFSAQDLALAAAILWTEAREEIAWRGRPRLEAIVAATAARASMRQTAPRPWKDSPAARARED